MKTIFKILAVLVLLVVVGLVFLVMNLDKGIKTAVETLGPEYTKAEVTLDAVDLSLQSGKGTLGGLVVGNPAGFKTGNAFSLGEITVDVDTNTIAEEVIVIEQIRILQPEITYETGKNGSNIDQLQKNVTEATGGGNASASTEKADSDPVKMIIKDLQISGAKLNYNNALLGDKTIDVNLPEIRLSNIGQKSGGATGAEVAKEILDAINKQAGSSIANSAAINDLKDQLKGQVETKAKEAVSKKLKGLFNRD